MAGLAFPGAGKAQEKVDSHEPQVKPAPQIGTNIEDIRLIPRTETSMPGRHPGKVVRVNAPGTAAGDKFDTARIGTGLTKGILALTGKRTTGEAWDQFVRPDDIVGIKVNPIGGKLLSTRPEIVDVIIAGLLEVGVPRRNIIIWDRRKFQLLDAGFTPERFPGIQIQGTELRGPNEKFYDDSGKLWSLNNIDREYAAYFADVEGKYNEQTLPYMINEGNHSYFTALVTRTCTKIINVPILKNAGSSVTLCLKNLSYGALSNTSRLHQLWNQSVAEPNAFPCLRDKVVLNIVDGLKACYDGGPGANAEFIWEPNLLLLGTDPVAVDTIGYEFMLGERMTRGIQHLEDKSRRAFLDAASDLGLGTSDRERIDLLETVLD